MTEGLGNQRKDPDYTDHSSNTQKTTGNRRKLAVTQTPLVENGLKKTRNQ